MTVAYNPRTGEYRYIKNHIGPKKFDQFFKKHQEQETTPTTKNIVTEDVELTSAHHNIISDAVQLAGEEASNVDTHYYLRGTE